MIETQKKSILNDVIGQNVYRKLSQNVIYFVEKIKYIPKIKPQIPVAVRRDFAYCQFNHPIGITCFLSNECSILLHFFLRYLHHYYISTT